MNDDTKIVFAIASIVALLVVSLTVDSMYKSNLNTKNYQICISSANSTVSDCLSILGKQ